MQSFYPKSWKERIAINRYNSHKEWEGSEPITVTIHQVIQRYGGPEEGGWYWKQGFPQVTHCVFSKKQAIKTYLQYCEEYEVWDQPDLGLTSTDCNWDVDFSSGIAEHYPKERPYYC